MKNAPQKKNFVNWVKKQPQLSSGLTNGPKPTRPVKGSRSCLIQYLTFLCIGLLFYYRLKNGAWPVPPDCAVVRVSTVGAVPLITT